MERRVTVAGTLATIGLALGACASTPDQPVTSGSASVTPSVTATTPAASPKTLDEAAWIAGLKALDKKMTDAVGSSSGTVTSKWLRDVSKTLGSCTVELSRLGPATDKEQVAYVAAKQGCAKYQEAAKCFAAKKADSPDIGKCDDPLNRGAELFATATAAADIIH
jgi:hypothetical protein